MSVTDYRAKPGGVFIGYAMDVIVPTVSYYALHALGLSPLWGLALGCSAAVVTTAINTFKQRRLDRVGLLVLLEVAGAFALVLFVHDPRLLMIRTSLYMEIGGIYLLATSSRGKPVNYSGARAMATRKDPERGAVFDRAWEESPKFRSTLRMSAMAWGVAFVLDGILRVLVVYRIQGDNVWLLSNGPHIVIIGLLFAISALFGRRMGEIVDKEAGGQVTPTVSL